MLLPAQPTRTLIDGRALAHELDIEPTRANRLHYT